MFQSSAFQSVAFQVAGIGKGTPQSSVSGFGYDGRTPYRKFQDEEYQKNKIKAEKTELQKVEAVLSENYRKAGLAANNAKIANNKNALRLNALEKEIRDEIARLLMVRNGIIERVRQNDEALIMMMIANRKKLRATTWQVNNSLQIH
jgi:hypothetical protein